MSGAASCSTCSAGHYSTAGSSSCSTCSAGQYSSAGSSSCSTCPFGQDSQPGSSECTLVASSTEATIAVVASSQEMSSSHIYGNYTRFKYAETNTGSTYSSATSSNSLSDTTTSTGNLDLRFATVMTATTSDPPRPNEALNLYMYSCLMDLIRMILI